MRAAPKLRVFRRELPGGGAGGGGARAGRADPAGRARVDLVISPDRKRL